jgi:Tropinone reductase 1
VFFTIIGPLAPAIVTTSAKRCKIEASAGQAAPMSSRWRLDGYRVIVTGGSKGLGLACVVEFLSLGASVLLTARGEADLLAAAEPLAKEHGAERVHVLAADVATVEGREALVAKAIALWGGALDGLVNNVGTNIRKPVAESTDAEYETMVSTNQTSAYYMCKACLPLLRKSERASIVNVASLAGLRSSGTGVIYAMTKAAMIHMSEAMACEWAAYGIRVNAVAPWMARTPLLEAAVAKDPSQLDKVCEATPLGSLGEPSDTAGAVAFLCMPAAAYVTGQCLAIDGGVAAQGYRGPCIAAHSEKPSANGGRKRMPDAPPPQSTPTVD